MTFLDRDRGRERRLDLFVALVAVSAVGLSTLLIVVQSSYFYLESNWTMFALFGGLLLLGETQPSFAMKFGDNGVVTPGWTFAFALMLLGMPVGALVIMTVANLWSGLQARSRPQVLIFNLSQIALSLSLGGLVLHVFGMHDSITELNAIPISWGAGILLSALTVLIVNGVLTTIVIGLHTGTGLFTTFRTGLALSMTADGALLSLAPVFVIAVDYSFVLVPLLASTSYIVIRSARSSLHRAHEANHDPLTGLLNRRAFDDRLSKTIGMFGSSTAATVLVMDFDGFKEINDSLGHSVGDALLVRFAERLVDLLPGNAAAARLGGDEFAVLLPGPAEPEALRRSLQSLHREMTKPLDVEGFPLSVAVSVGVAVAPTDGSNPEDLMAAADLAMYRSKQSDAGVEFHRTSVHQAGRAGRIDLLADLSRAIEHDELFAHYQPIVRMSTGRVEAVEALVRWRHPRRGLIQPNDFIGLAEQTDLIDALTERMLMRSMYEVLELGLDLGLAVNVSPRSLHQRTFISMVQRSLDATGFAPHRLELEITERALTTETERTVLTIRLLREAGVQIAIDDFGTGYSSFGALRLIRADRLKIDRQFTRDVDVSPDDRLVVRTITDLGHGLGLQVVAEGVETPGVRAALAEIGCDFAQGYEIAAPQTIDSLRVTLGGWPTPSSADRAYA